MLNSAKVRETEPDRDVLSSDLREALGTAGEEAEAYARDLARVRDEYEAVAQARLRPLADPPFEDARFMKTPVWAPRCAAFAERLRRTAPLIRKHPAFFVRPAYALLNQLAAPSRDPVLDSIADGLRIPNGYKCPAPFQPPQSHFAWSYTTSGETTNVVQIRAPGASPRTTSRGDHWRARREGFLLWLLTSHAERTFRRKRVSLLINIMATWGWQPTSDVASTDPEARKHALRERLLRLRRGGRRSHLAAAAKWYEEHRGDGAVVRPGPTGQA